MQVLLGARCHTSAQLGAYWCLILTAAVYERYLASAVAISTRGTRRRDYLLLRHCPAHRVYGSRVVLGTPCMSRDSSVR